MFKWKAFVKINTVGQNETCLVMQFQWLLLSLQCDSKNTGNINDIFIENFIVNTRLLQYEVNSK